MSTVPSDLCVCSEASVPSHVSVADRDVRQRELIPPQRLATCSALVVGVGAIGRQVALQLAASGVPNLELFDADTVGVENLAPQAYWQQDLGRSKVDATAQACRLLNPAVQLSIHARRFSRASPRHASSVQAEGQLAVFCCVDSITTRQLVWESLRSRAEFFADGRMAAEVIRVLASDRPAQDEHYPTTFFAAQQAYAGSCTGRSTVYAASIAAGLMLHQFTRWLRGLAVDRDLCLNLLSSEMSDQ